MDVNRFHTVFHSLLTTRLILNIRAAVAAGDDLYATTDNRAEEHQLHVIRTQGGPRSKDSEVLSSTGRLELTRGLDSTLST